MANHVFKINLITVAHNIPDDASRALVQAVLQSTMKTMLEKNIITYQDDQAQSIDLSFEIIEIEDE